ncbi:hypothetical protein [Paenibacillus sp. MBLB4367]|uniref:hypothetical protein n=1 Tax=Paenibacillus sp. MBLB4367 TaxID=3384767 RepID=UPI0039082C10
MKAIEAERWRGEIKRAAIPYGRDPFINTPMLQIGKGSDGEERFWISSWNSVSGTIGIVVTESGKERIYRFPSIHSGFYSAAQEDGDTLWLCGDLSRVVRLTLSTGEIECCETGAPSALVFQGMALDQATGKLFAAAFPPPSTAAFSFDYRNRRPVKQYAEVCREHYMRAAFANGDGTFSIVIDNPDVALLQWDPRKETVESVVLGEIAGLIPNPSQRREHVKRLIRSEEGWTYFPYCGWYDPLTRQIVSGPPLPEREMEWFARRGSRVMGVHTDFQNASIAVWNMTTGRVTEICRIPDANAFSVNITDSGDIVAVNLYGVFYRFDGETGALLVSKRLPADSVAHVDCLCRIDRDRLLGTPFITQRFWEIDLRTDKGTDCGRAAPGVGEILLTWNVQGKVYMAAYAGGELVEYDPARHPCFPENPRVVADPPGGMRPVAGAAHGHLVYYSCSHEYGILGCVLTRYDTISGIAAYKDDPVPGQMIRSLWHDGETRGLIAGTTMDADCQSCPPASPACYFVRLDERDLSAVRKSPAPEGTRIATVCGPMGQGRYLCTVSGDFSGDGRTRMFVLDAERMSVPGLDEMDIVPGDTRSIVGSGIPGLFVIWNGNAFELWDMNVQRRLQLLHEEEAAYHCFVQDDSVYLVTPGEVVILEGCLSSFRETI